MTELVWSKMYGVTITGAGGDYEVQEFDSAPVEGGHHIRVRRGCGVHIDFAPTGKLHATREAAEARRVDLQRKLDALRDTVPAP